MKKLGVIHRGMMAMLKTVISKKDSASLREEDKEMLETYGKVVHFTDKATIKPIIEFVNTLR